MEREPLEKEEGELRSSKRINETVPTGGHVRDIHRHRDRGDARSRRPGVTQHSTYEGDQRWEGDVKVQRKE